MFFMYFVIAMVNAVLTFKIHEQEKKARDKEEKEYTIKLYNTLLNSLSHEFRTPIATIIGATDNLLGDASRLSQADKDNLLQNLAAWSAANWALPGERSSCSPRCIRRRIQSRARGTRRD